MKIAAYDVYKGNVPVWAKNGDASFKWAGLDEIYSRSDFIRLNCALTEENRGLIDKETLAKMKKSCFLVNASRGGLVVDDDLAAALNNGVIAGAGIYVLGTEPPEPDNPLREYDASSPIGS